MCYINIFTHRYMNSFGKNIFVMYPNYSTFFTQYLDKKGGHTLFFFYNTVSKRLQHHIMSGQNDLVQNKLRSKQVETVNTLPKNELGKSQND